MLLLHRGADTGAATPRGTALQVAATRARPDVIAILLRHGADVCPHGFCSTFRAYNNAAAHILLCFQFSQPNKVANLSFTPLASSLVGGSLECMKLLIQVLHYNVLRKNDLYFHRIARLVVLCPVMNDLAPFWGLCRAKLETRRSFMGFIPA
jgi:hypothetical protein